MTLRESFSIKIEDIDQSNPVEKSIYLKCKHEFAKFAYTTYIFQWYLKEKKLGVPEDELKRKYVDAYQEIVDRLIQYDILKKQIEKFGKKDAEIIITPKFKFQLKDNKGLNRIQRVEGLSKVISAMSDYIEEKSTDVVNEYKMTSADYANIKLIGQSTNMIVWSTKTFESTNKFIYFIWRNDNMNSSYGEPEENSPFCTRQATHWKSYSHNNPDYQQFWYFKKPENKTYQTGDLSSQNVKDCLVSMINKGYDLLIGLNDTYNDNNNRDDDTCHGDYSTFILFGKNYQNEIKHLNDELFVIQGDRNLTIDGKHITSRSSIVNRKVFIKNEAPQPIQNNDVYDGTLDISQYDLKTLNGCPKKITGRFYACYNMLTTLDGAPEHINKICDISENNQLTSLNGCPQYVGGSIDLTNCQKLKTLIGICSHIHGNLFLRGTGLTSLVGGPIEVGGEMTFPDDLMTLEGAPSSIGRELNSDYYNEFLDQNFYKTLKYTSVPQHEIDAYISFLHSPSTDNISKDGHFTLNVVDSNFDEKTIQYLHEYDKIGETDEYQLYQCKNIDSIMQHAVVDKAAKICILLNDDYPKDSLIVRKSAVDRAIDENIEHLYDRYADIVEDVFSDMINRYEKTKYAQSLSDSQLNERKIKFDEFIQSMTIHKIAMSNNSCDLHYVKDGTLSILPDAIKWVRLEHYVLFDKATCIGTLFGIGLYHKKDHSGDDVMLRFCEYSSNGIGEIYEQCPLTPLFNGNICIIDNEAIDFLNNRYYALVEEIKRKNENESIMHIVDEYQWLWK